MPESIWRSLNKVAEVTPRKPPPKSHEDTDSAAAHRGLCVRRADGNSSQPHRGASISFLTRQRSGANGIRLVSAPPVGQDEHRSGWPYVLQSITPLLHPHGMLFDDFVERTFFYEMRRKPHREPWIGAFHHPFNVSPELDPAGSLSGILKLPAVVASLRHMKAAVVLSEHLADQLRNVLDVPILCVKHPTKTPELKWSPQAFFSNESPKLVQVGAHLRNTRLIHKVEPLKSLGRYRLDNPVWWLPGYDRRVATYWKRKGNRREYSGVRVIARQDNEAYDRLLASNIVCSEVFAASANNLVVECIVRNTPVVINCHPAVEEYLGSDYPLYFDHPEEIPSLLTTDRILQAHHHLLRMNKQPFDGGVFREVLLAWIRETANGYA